MSNLITIGQFLLVLFGGLGIFSLGCTALWFVAEYKRIGE